MRFQRVMTYLFAVEETSLSKIGTLFYAFFNELSTVNADVIVVIRVFFLHCFLA